MLSVSINIAVGMNDDDDDVPNHPQLYIIIH
jgi:hypothetical protein